MTVLIGVFYIGAAILSVAQLYEIKGSVWATLFAWAGFLAETVWLVRVLAAEMRAQTLLAAYWMDALIWVAAGAYLLAGRRAALFTARAFVFPIVVVLWGLAEWAMPREWGVGGTVFWLGAGLSALAGAAFLLLAVFGIMYIEKERELSQKRIRLFYYQLPALDHLDRWAGRMLGFGWILFTAALSVSRIGVRGGWAALAAPAMIWIVYAIIAAGRLAFHWSGHRMAVGGMVAFLALTIEIYGIAWTSVHPPMW